MSFMERARALYQRGDEVRAAFVLAEGVKQDPANEEALNWFLQMYVEEVEGPGLEHELIRVLETQPDGSALFEGVREELKRRQQVDRLSFLDRVHHLRQRAAAASRQQHGTRGREASRHGGVPARREAVEPIEQVTALLEESGRSGEGTRRQSRRRRGRERTDESAQGVLPLDVGEGRRGGRDSWRGFQGVASHVDPEGLPVPVRSLRPQFGDGEPEEAPAQGQPNASDVRSVATGEDRTGPLHRVRASRTPLDVDENQAPSDKPRRDGSRTSRASQKIRRTLPAYDQLLSLEADEQWSFGDTFGPDGSMMGSSAPDRKEDRSTGPRAPVGNRLRRTRPNPIVLAVPQILRGIGRGLRWTVSGRRGPLMLLLVAMLGASAVGYRACTRLVETQLAEADRALALADGDGLRRAVAIYSEHLPDEPSEIGERHDFARALLAADYGDEPEDPRYQSQDASTVYGAAAVALNLLARGNLALSRPLGEEIVGRFGETWLAHWTRGRIATAEGAWERARVSFLEARSIDESAVLPILGLLDIALRAGRDVEAEALLAVLAERTPDHPLLPVARAALAFGLDPLDARAGSLQVALPDPQAQSLWFRTSELVAYLRARQALAAWQLDQVGRIMRSLREEHPGPLGVRTSLLEALLAARRYRLPEATQALEQALRAAPEQSEANAVIRRIAAEILTDLGRPDLALERLADEPGTELTRARLLVDAGQEAEALRLLGALIDRPNTQSASLRALVDFHLRRGVPDRARLRAGGLQAAGDQAYAAARLADHELDWDDVRDHAEEAMQHNANDLESLFLWARATAHLGLAERAIERIDERAARSILVGEFDRARLEVLVASGRAPRATLAEFVGLLQSTEPTSMTRLATLALAYESIGDLERAAEAAQRVLAGEPNNRTVHALLGRIYHQAGQPEQSQLHLRAYLALAPETEPTDWARQILTEEGTSSQ